MSRTTFCFAIALGLLAVPGCSSEITVSGSVTFESQVIDLGDVLQHHVYELRYPFTVVGDGPVRFNNIDLDHGMVMAGIAAPFAMGEWIPLGAKGEIVATFDAGRYIGDMGSRLSLHGDFEAGREELKVLMVIHPVFEMDPTVVQFGSIREVELEDGLHSQVVEVTGLKDFEVLRWKRTPPGVSIEALEGVETTSDGRVVRSFRVTAGPEMTEGRMSSSFIAETDLGVELEFMVNAEVLGAVKYAPSSRIAFGIFDQGKEKRRSLKIEAVDPALPVPLPSVTIGGDAALVISAEVRIVTQDRLYEISLNIGKHAPPGSYNGVLRITYPEASGLAPKEIMLNARIRSSS